MTAPDQAKSARYVVGIDLGTTHTAIASIDLDLVEGEDAPPSALAIPQLVGQGALEARALLPSFLWLPHPSEGAQPLPWDDARRHVVGELARTRALEAPLRVVSSAKSWLCHPSADRRAPILPLTPPGAAVEDSLEKVSPVEASRRYLSHVREAWDHAVARGDQDACLANQEVVLTVPASFDAGARELTADAARQAGLPNVTLLEEPQAALYAWLEGSHGQWRKQLRAGDLLLVVDVGGGTTDFSAISVVDESGTLTLRRVAVGDHILLGGDNMDLALAILVRRKLEAEGRALDPWQQQSLVAAARGAKELLFSRPDLAEAPIVIAARGSKLIGGSIRTAVSRGELDALLVDGFFPRASAADRPASRAGAGFVAQGLRYAQDAAVTRHLAAFLARQAGALGDAGARTFLHPTAVLFNGGVMKAAVLRERVMACLDAWLAAEGAGPARVLEGADLDLSVAKGAAYYAYAKRGRGIRIRGGTARSYYVGIESAAPAVPGLPPEITALCVAPFGVEEGSPPTAIPVELGLVVGEPARFRFFGSSVRRDDRPGQVLTRWGEGELEELPPIEATLAAGARAEGEVVPISLESAVTELGTVRIDAVGPVAGERWALELNVREG